jgi:hypothetical protein
MSSGLQVVNLRLFGDPNTGDNSTDPCKNCCKPIAGCLHVDIGGSVTSPTTFVYTIGAQLSSYPDNPLCTPFLRIGFGPSPEITASWSHYVNPGNMPPGINPDTIDVTFNIYYSGSSIFSFSGTCGPGFVSGTEWVGNCPVTGLPFDGDNYNLIYAGPRDPSPGSTLEFEVTGPSYLDAGFLTGPSAGGVEVYV